MNLQDANFEDLTAFYFHGTDAEAAARELRSAIDANRDQWLARMLRDHNEEGIGDPNEIAFRSGVDDLIVCYSVLEIAATAGLIELRSTREWSWNAVAVLLKNDRLRKFYTDFYPDRLPQLLLKRLEGAHTAVEPESVQPLCLQFLELDRRFVENHRAGYLLRLLDDFIITRAGRDVHFGDIVSLLETPEQLVASLFKTEKDKTVLDHAVAELGQFFAFCHSLDLLLQSAAAFPIFQAEVWARYAYWFENIAQRMKSKLRKALEQFTKWKPSRGGSEAALEVQAYVSTAIRIIDSLCSGPYAAHLDVMLRK